MTFSMACQEASKLCSGLGSSKCIAFTSRRKPLKMSFGLNRAPQCLLGETQLSVRCPARPEPHVKQIVSNVAKVATAVACSTLLAVAGIPTACSQRLCICPGFDHMVVLHTCVLSVIVCPGAHARLEGVNKPELLPDSFTTVIDVAGFLTPGEVGSVQAGV